MTSRIHCGFHRAGIVLAVPPAGLGLWLAVTEWRRQANEEAETSRILRAMSDADLEKLAASMISAATPPPERHQADYTTASVLLAVALALYASARAVGWVLAGFLSPSR